MSISKNDALEELYRLLSSNEPVTQDIIEDIVSKR